MIFFGGGVRMSVTCIDLDIYVVPVCGSRRQRHDRRRILRTSGQALWAQQTSTPLPGEHPAGGRSTCRRRYARVLIRRKTIRGQRSGRSGSCRSASVGLSSTLELTCLGRHNVHLQIRGQRSDRIWSWHVVLGIRSTWSLTCLDRYHVQVRIKGYRSGRSRVTLVCHVWALYHLPTDNQSVCVLSQLLLLIMNR